MELKKQVVNTFFKGMDKDIDISLLSKESYIDARNFRLVSSTGNTSMSLETVDGNTLIGSGFTYGYYICGYCNIRNTLILFTTSNTTEGVYSGFSKIYKSTVSDNTLGSFSVIYDDFSTSDGSLLGLNTNNPIQATGRYESNLIQKIYFTDGYNNLRFFDLNNILLHQTIDKFDIIPDFGMSSPQFQSLVNGDLPSGKIQYAYQLYNQYGAETLFSPCSSLISLTSSTYTSNTNKLFSGSNVNTNSGKGVVFTIPSYSGFTKIRIISILYIRLNGIPSINIIADENLPSTSITSPLTFTDFGTISLGTYTYEEIAVIGRYLFSSKTIETKNNYLFGGNILQRQWDVDFDARAYRFPSSSAVGIISSGSTLVFDSNGNSYLLVSGVASAPEKHDCINPYNNLALDGLRTDLGPSNSQYYNFAYDYTGTVLGGSGINVSYSFTTTSFDLDDYASGNQLSVEYPFTDFSNPNIEITLKGYQRDEIYPFGIIFRDAKGRVSTVKWIGDIRFPKQTIYPIATAVIDSSTGNVKGSSGSALGITFTISGLDSVIASGATSYQIVRCQRQSTDRTVIAQGISLPLILRPDYNGVTSYMHMLYPEPDSSTIRSDPKLITGGSHPYGQYNNLIEFISPEVNINQNIICASGDRLDVIGQYNIVSSFSNVSGTYLSYDSQIGSGGGTSNNSFVYKYYGTTTLSFQTQPINSIYLTDPITYGVKQASLNIGTTYPYESVSMYWNSISTDIGTKLILVLNSSLTPYVLGSSTAKFGGVSQTKENAMMCNYRRINGTTSSTITTQYGGNTYYDRQNRVYIECSSIASCSTGSTSLTSYSGDTYICMYDYLRNLVQYPSIEVVGEDRSQLLMYFPVESSINLRYRSDISFSKTVDDVYHTRVFMTEKAGSYGTGIPYQYTQSTDLYLYNSVYSQEDTTIKFFPKNDNIIYGDKLFDSRVIVSDKKINGELSDSWLQFTVNNFLDVDNGYGPVNSLLQYNNNLFFFQDNAFGDISVSPRSLLSDNNPGALVLGTGAVLDRYDYISTIVGNKFKFGNVIGQNGIYWYDVPSKTIYNYLGNTRPLSKLKGLFSYFNIFGDNSTTCITGYDYKYNEVIFSLTNGNGVTSTIAYSELADAFISFYDYKPSWFISMYNKQLYTVPILSVPYGGNTLWLQNSGNKASFYGYTTGSFHPYIYPSTLTYIINDNFQSTKIFDSIQYNTKSKSYTGSDITDMFSDTFNTLQCWNSKQNTGVVSIVVNDPTSLTLNLTNNTFKREGGFITTLPRNIVSSATASNVDIFNSSNWDSSRSFQERLRDKYLIVQLAYTNNNNYAFSVPFITTNYRVSIR
jgi:hypothetical protein